MVIAPWEIKYSGDDIQPLKGDNYYRLKQVDKDGKITYSNTIVLKGKIALRAKINNVYPNPVTSFINISINLPADNKISFIVSDLKGNLLIKHNTSAKAGNNILTLNTQSLAAGSYILKAIGNNGKSIGETKLLSSRTKFSSIKKGKLIVCLFYFL